MDNIDDPYNSLKDILGAYKRMVIDKNNPDYNQATIDNIYNELKFYLDTLEGDRKGANPSKEIDITNLIKEVVNLQKKFGDHASNKVLGMPENNELDNNVNDSSRDLRGFFGDEFDNANDSIGGLEDEDENEEFSGGRKKRSKKIKKSRRSKTRKRRRSKTRKRRRSKTRKRRS